jgi:predicted NBD/HSP70 family sugar kinase
MLPMSKGDIHGGLPRSRRRVLSAVTRQHPVSRAELAAQLDLSSTTVSEAVADLLRRDLLESVSVRGARGRPKTLLRAKSGGGVVLGVDVGRRHARIALADLDEVVLDEQFIHVSPDDRGADILTRAMQQAAVLLRRSDRTSLSAVCVGIPAPFDRTSTVTDGPISSPWNGVDIVAAIRESFAVPVVVDNDANLGALGELRHGAARDARHAVYVKIASGIGAGLIVDGQVYRGANDTAGELGHFYADINNRPCRCGGRGCLETVSSLTGLLRIAGPLLGASTTTADLEHAIRTGDRRVLRPLVDAGRHLGHVLAMVCNLTNPSLIIIGGPFTEAPEEFYESVVEAIGSVTATPASGLPEVVRSQLGDRAGVAGAVARAVEIADGPSVPGE